MGKYKCQQESKGRLYDQSAYYLPKGKLKAVQAYAANKGISVNCLINTLLREAIGQTAEEWQDKETA